MNYQRILMLTDLGADPQPACEAIRRFAPSATHLTVIAQQPPRLLAWVTPAAPPDLNDAARRALDDLRLAAEGTAGAVAVALEPELSAEALAEAVAACDIDLVVVGSVPLRTLSMVGELRKRRSVPVLCVRSAPASSGPEGGNRLLCEGSSSRGRSVVVRFIRDHASPPDRAVLLSPEPLSSEDLLRLREVSDIPSEVNLTAPGKPLRYLLGPQVRQGFDLIVLPRFPPVVSLATLSGPPVLILPPLRPAGLEWERAIDVPDLVDDGALIRARLEYAVGVGRRTPIADQEVAFVRASEIVARATFCQGEAELPSGLGHSLGVIRTHGKAPTDPLAAVEGRVAVLRADAGTLILFDAEIDNDHLSLIRRVTWADAVGVRVRSMRSCASLRAKLRAAGLPPRVIDAGAVLGEGEALDVPALADAVRLARVAARMRADGFSVAAVVYRGPHKPATQGFAALRAEELAAVPTASAAATGRAPLAQRLDLTTGSDPVTGNTIEVELHNPTARAWLLSAINDSRHRLHFQVYMALDDDVGRPVEAALAAAAARGVTVRVLVDSLHGLHGSLGVRNPILERLSSRPGIDFRVWKPITGLPSLEDLKQRDHRKLVVADGRLALLGGRNLSHEYYAGFEEVPLTPEMTWRMVPWLDAGARVQGPAVAALERSFLQAWTDAGGEPFDISTPAPAGPTTARVVVHRGLRDAYTLEAYLALIETARSHIYAVNGFPLLLEIQHALLRAIRRGVRVRTLFGNLTPRHRSGPFKGPWSAARTAATSFVHSRMDALVAAGGECYEFVVRHRSEWDPAIGDVWPHVHAKTMSADGRLCAVGSANLDITAGYWESELLLIVEDEAVTRTVEARFDELIAASARVDPNDAEWRRRAEQRQWMRYWPGTLSG
jgi:phosphatidylserine/phosphatidylglycerophosphate/cardiolipin synthase-like enzyme